MLSSLNHRVLRPLAAAALSTSLVAVGTAVGFAAPLVKEVTVKGATFIAEDDIRTVCDLQTDRRYSQADLRAAEACFEETGAFQSVSLRQENDRLIVDVKELNDRPGRLEFGIGYDSKDGAFASALYERFNILPGVFGGAELRAGEDVRTFKSYIFSKEAIGSFDFGIDASVRQVKGEDYGYRYKQMTFEPYLAKDLAPGLRGEFGLGYRYDRLNKVRADAIPAFGQDIGERRDAYLRAQLDYLSERDANSALTWGASAMVKVYGIGGSDKIVETALSADMQMALSDSYTLGLRAAAGHIDAKGGAKLSNTDRFILGSTDLRGFANRGVGPSVGNYRVGGESFGLASVEVQRDVGEIFGSATKLGLFADVGTAWGGAPGAQNNAQSWRSAAGVSLTMDLGGVPLSAYVAQPIKSYDGDKEQVFGLGIHFLR